MSEAVNIARWESIARRDGRLPMLDALEACSALRAAAGAARWKAALETIAGCGDPGSSEIAHAALTAPAREGEKI